MKRTILFGIRFCPWYIEHHSGIRMHSYLSFFINNFPLIAIIKWDNPHDGSWETYDFQLLCFSVKVLYKDFENV